MVTAIGPDGAPYFRGRVPEAAAPAPNAPPASGRVTFDVEPGEGPAAAVGRRRASQVLDTETREIAVPDLTGGRSILGTPQLFRARTARDFQQIKADPEAMPVDDARVLADGSPAGPRAGVRTRRHRARR